MNWNDAINKIEGERRASHGSRSEQQAKKDTERLDELQKLNIMGLSVGKDGAWLCTVKMEGGVVVVYRGRTVREAIDAAITTRW